MSVRYSRGGVQMDRKYLINLDNDSRLASVQMSSRGIEFCFVDMAGRGAVLTKPEMLELTLTLIMNGCLGDLSLNEIGGLCIDRALKQSREPGVTK